MKLPISSRSLAVVAGIALVSPAFAVVNIDYVTVGNINNAADPATGSLYGAAASHTPAARPMARNTRSAPAWATSR